MEITSNTPIYDALVRDFKCDPMLPESVVAHRVIRRPPVPVREPGVILQSIDELVEGFVSKWLGATGLAK